MDQDLVVRAQHGDTGAFEALVRGSLASCHATCIGILHSPDDARDATQQAFITAWRRLPTLRDPNRFDAWLQAIARNASRDMLRLRHRVREVELDTSTEQLAGPAEPTGGLMSAVDSLPASARQVVIRHYVDDESVTSIAQSLGIPPGTVKSRLFNARASLRALLAKEQTR